MTITLKCGDRVTLPTYSRQGGQGQEFYCPTHDWQLPNPEQDEIDALSDLAKYR
jgi:hypothetical protein